MNARAGAENARMLASLLGIGEIEAAEKLGITVAVTASASNQLAQQLASHVVALVERTVQRVTPPSSGMQEGSREAKVELIIGDAAARTTGIAVFASLDSDVVRLSASRTEAGGVSDSHPIALLVAACYACAAILRAAVGSQLPFPCPDPLIVDVRAMFGNQLPRPDSLVDFGAAHLAGAGAIGNGFVSGLAQFSARGRLYISDDDLVTGGNLQRCLHFSEADVDKAKADVLCATIARLSPKVDAKPFVGRIQNHPAKFAGAWLPRLIVGVDSPRARRELQSEIPGEVFDASTTGAAEIVMHFHKQPTELACLACAYHESPEEYAHEKHVAAWLGVTLAEVQESRVSREAADKICRRYPNLTPANVVGTPYDTLFKALCSSAHLLGESGQQALTPFAFVSVLAGALLATEFVIRVSGGDVNRFNEWRLSPWSPPVIRRRRILARRPDCSFCGKPVLSKVARELWTKHP